MATAAQESTRITVTLCWSVSGNVFKEVVCTTEEWGTIIRGDKEEWSYVPTRKLHVVRADGNILLEGLFLAAGKDITLPIYAFPASFDNALREVGELPNGQRKWRTEFKQHVAKTFYMTPEHWGLTVQQQDFWLVRMLQVWARETRIRFPPRFPRRRPDGTEDIEDRFCGRYRHGATELLADRFLISDDDAEKEWRFFESINLVANMSLTRFLWTDENQFHCFVL